MTTKRANRYKCDFCRKVGYAAGHMKRHESGCTLNPNRVCRVCKMDRKGYAKGEGRQIDITHLIDCLPKHPRSYYEESDFGPHTDAVHTEVNLGLVALRKLTDCPACIMAALRQAHIPVPMATEFSFTDEMKAIWAEINDANQEKDMRDCHYA